MHDRPNQDLSRPCPCETKEGQQITPRGSLQRAFWVHQKFGQSFLLSTPFLSGSPSVWTASWPFLMECDTPLVWQIINSVSALDHFAGLCGYCLCCGSHSTYPCGQWILPFFPSSNRNPSSCMVITESFPKPPGRKSRPGLFTSLLRGSLRAHDWLHSVGTHPLAFLVENFPFLKLCVCTVWMSIVIHVY